MGAKSKYRGNEIEYINEEWVYADTKQLVSENKNRPCGKCGKAQTKEGHDYCLGTLPGVMNACCGHGNINEAYVQLLDGTCINGYNAKKMIDILKNQSEGNTVNSKPANCAIFDVKQSNVNLYLELEKWHDAYKNVYGDDKDIIETCLLDVIYGATRGEIELSR